MDYRKRGETALIQKKRSHVSFHIVRTNLEYLNPIFPTCRKFPFTQKSLKWMSPEISEVPSVWTAMFIVVYLDSKYKPYFLRKLYFSSKTEEM